MTWSMVKPPPVSSPSVKIRAALLAVGPFSAVVRMAAMAALYSGVPPPSLVARASMVGKNDRPSGVNWSYSVIS
jgi:hypothetical protein